MKEFESDIVSSIRVLSAGGILLYPTDTIWGIGCDATNAQAVERIFELKKRADSKAMIVLVADTADILRFTSQPDLAIFDFLKTKLKPTTVIYEGGIGLAENLLAVDGSVAIRITADPFCKHLIKRFRKPIVSTSANISGTDSPSSFNDISTAIRAGVDYIVLHRQNDNNPSQPSAVIRWRNGKEIVVRE